MSDTQKPAPTTAEVSTLGKRLADLERKADELGEQERELTNQIAECHATGAGNLDKFTQQRREVKALRADILEVLPLLRERLAERREAAARGEAQKRLTGITRAFGSLRQELDADEARVKAKAAAYAAEVHRLNEHYQRLAQLRAEANALVDRFLGLAAPTFTPVVIPAKREGCVAAAMTAQSVTFLDQV